MKALSLKQPWASMVANGTKTIETRTWRTSYRGPLAIHASQPDGRIIATAVLTDVRPMVFEDIIPARLRYWPGGVLFAWELRDIRLVVPPIPARGKLGLWDLPPDYLAAIDASSQPLIVLCDRAEFPSCVGCGSPDDLKICEHCDRKVCFYCAHITDDSCWLCRRCSNRLFR